MAVSQPEWHQPPDLVGDIQVPKLSIYNSLTKSKTPFIPLDRSGKKVTWYACGPTVYDDSHLGHARNYVSTDIVRRILQDYFNFDVEFVMNITDVDDKIILAARQQHLLAEWIEQNRSSDGAIKQTTTDAMQAYIAKNLSLLDPHISPAAAIDATAKSYGHVMQGKSIANDNTAPGDKEAKVKMHIKTLSSAVESLQSSSDVDTRLGLAAGVLLPYIDSQRSTTIDGSDHAIFTKLTKKYEQRFFDDMKALNVRYPDKVTRVTEYGPEIVEFVEKIQQNGFAYEHEGSVYYDVGAWESSGGHYARLEPWNRNDKELQADGEGALSAKKGTFKKSGADFALWKASKTGEPYWQSPWGEGRPGWHIECSAMASKEFGQTFDIHSGGIDLAFPHHDNELAQSEAYWCRPHAVTEGKQWVNYFIHMGHLSIQGSKMSKSLKNFTTIKEALASGDWTPRSLRILFLLGSWRDGLEITPAAIKTAVAWEERVDNFFLNARSAVNDANGSLEKEHTNAAEKTVTDSMSSKLHAAETRVHNALCDSFDTPAALRAISDLLTEVNSEKQVPAHMMLTISQWVNNMVDMLGLDDAPSSTIGWSGLDVPHGTLIIAQRLSNLRDSIRSQAVSGTVDADKIASLEVATGELSIADERSGDADSQAATAYATFVATVQSLKQKQAAPKEWLAACDYLRDNILWNLGVYLEDREGKPALIRPLSTTLRRERTDREALAADKAAAKQKAKADAEAAEREKLLKGKLSHLDMFRTTEYSEWDADGLPTKDKEGAEVAKSKSKKLKKDWDRQKRLHEAYLAASGASQAS